MKIVLCKRNLIITLIAITLTSSLVIYYLFSQQFQKDETLEISIPLKKINPKELPVTFDFDGPAYPNPSITFNGELPTLPSRMIVYRVIEPNITEAYVREIGAKMVGIPKNAELQRSSRLGLFFLRSSNWLLEVNPSNGKISIDRLNVINSMEDKRDYPSTEQCKKIADEYLKKYNFLTDDLYFSGIADNTSSLGAFSVGYKRMINNYKTLGAGAIISVDVNDNGDVVGFSKQWQQIEPYGTCEIKKPEEALKELMNGKGVLMNGDSGKIVSIELWYYCSPQKQEFVQPIYYFQCTGDEGDFYGVVPAIKDK